MSTYTAITDADREAMLAAVGVEDAGRAVRRHPRRAAAGPPARPAARGRRAGRLRPPARPRRAQRLHRGRAVLPRRRHVRPLRPGGRRHAHVALGVPHAVHAVPARGLAGHAAGHLRVPDGDLRADGAAGRQRVALRRRRARSPRRATSRARQPAAPRVVVLGRRCIRTRARRCAPTRTASARRSSRCRCATAAPTRMRWRAAIDDDTVRRRSSQNPNFFGAVEDAAAPGVRGCRRPPAPSSVVSYDPIALGILAPPGECGADVCVGEGQPLGNRLDFGGPSFGFFAAHGGVRAPDAGAHRGRDRRRRRAAAASCSRCRRASSTSAARRRRRTSAPTRRSTRWAASST